ncbi:TauD/TfdA family dioxygenase [Streptomyces radicis]|uniref:TauD/TfdA family dioxygenase n=1 Tax=Streptomyces radicis TaxID=1750517 RepID=A0A3A9WIQ5_9ACTN|nr:TauD/TfdA family dioxygenase [Streptomyces radicis]RKN07596.1 TauD/TfdA family dioxygenase [Streptomyces radicis]RKN18319.1 TauD/TfdA family dioxygenase [Streptomyces radicis]
MSTHAEGRTGALVWQVTSGKPATTRIDGPKDIDEACRRLTALRPAVLDALHEHGALYIRGLPVRGVDDFARVRDVLIPQSAGYREKATPRSDYGDGVFSSTDLPPSQPIAMHNENSYTLSFPGLLLFGCLVAPEFGGATPVADCRKVLNDLPPRLVDRMRAVGWQLKRSYSDIVSTDWRTAFSAESEKDVERYCDDNLIAYAWQQDGDLRTRQLRPGVIRHPSTGAEVWFNHLAFWNEWALDDRVREALLDEFGPDGLPFNSAFGDGEPLTREDLRTIQAAYEAATVREQWEVGDLLLVDNILAAHGRDAFRGERKIVVAMGNPVDIDACRPSTRPAATSV